MWHYQVEKAVWYELFVNLVYTRHYPSIHPHDSEICDSRLSYLNLELDATEGSVNHEFFYHEAFEARKRIFTRLKDNTCRQHAEPGQTMRQAGNKPEGTLTSQAQYRALV